MFAPCIHNTQKPKIWILYIPTWLVCFVILPKATVCSTRNSFETFRQRNNLDVIKRRLLLLLLLPPSWIPIETAAYTVRSKRCRPGDIPNHCTPWHCIPRIYIYTLHDDMIQSEHELNHFESFWITSMHAHDFDIPGPSKKNCGQPSLDSDTTTRKVWNCSRACLKQI